MCDIPLFQNLEIRFLSNRRGRGVMYLTYLGHQSVNGPFQPVSGSLPLRKIVDATTSAWTLEVVLLLIWLQWALLLTNLTLGSRALSDLPQGAFSLLSRLLKTLSYIVSADCQTSGPASGLTKNLVRSKN